MASCDWIEISKGLSGPISWALVIAGWFFISRDHNNRVRRAEIRKVVDDMKNVILQIEATARGYWLKDASDPLTAMAALHLKRQLKHLANMKNILKRNDQEFELEMSMKLFRQTITLGEFESRARKALKENDVRFEEITNSSVEFIDNLESEFERMYCKQGWKCM